MHVSRHRYLYERDGRLGTLPGLKSSLAVRFGAAGRRECSPPVGESIDVELPGSEGSMAALMPSGSVERSVCAIQVTAGSTTIK